MLAVLLDLPNAELSGSF